MICNIILDWSGTLVDDLAPVLEATNYVLQKAGQPAMSLEQFRAEFCLPFTQFYSRHTPDVPIEQLERWFHAYFRKVRDCVVPLPHAREFLEFCRENRLRTFVLSTVKPAHFKAQLARVRFGSLVGKTYLGVRDKRVKIGEVLSTNRLVPSETLFVGDMQHDIEAAKLGGVISCAVLTGYNSLEQLRASAPDLIVRDLGELREILERNSFEISAPHAVGTTPAPIATASVRAQSKTPCRAVSNRQE
ncbi:MAG: HAD family hydrolase [Verrucomicrobiae bacterium]|nr:HAD family hydrolase [Verrucomicrobiae bacterium]MDW7980424.1 HAD family hydrolase [Verrucomicrobiales bacterium]